MLGKRLYSPSLKDVAWLEDTLLIILIFHTFVCNFFFPGPRLLGQIYRQMYGKLEKLTERRLAKLHQQQQQQQHLSFKHGGF